MSSLPDQRLEIRNKWGGFAISRILTNSQAMLCIVQRGVFRYMFEVKTLQNNPADHGKFARDTLRIGFSTSSASLILGEDAHSVYFDSAPHAHVCGW